MAPIFAEGSADDVLVIALAALVYNTRCGGKDDHGRTLEDLMVAVETASTGYAAGAVWPTPPAWKGTDQWAVDYTPQRHARARAPACAHAHAGGGVPLPGSDGGSIERA